MVNAQEWLNQFGPDVDKVWDGYRAVKRNISGEMDFRRLTKLATIHLREQLITKVINLPTTLTAIYLEKSPIIQDIKDFAHLVNLHLQYVDLNDTGFYGDISAFYKMDKLSQLRIKNTQITGSHWYLPILLEIFESNNVFWMPLGSSSGSVIRWSKQPSPWKLIESSTQENEKLKKEAEKYKEKWHEEKDKTKKLEKEKSTLTSQNSQLQKDKTQLTTERDNLKKEMQAKDKEITKLNQQLEEHKKCPAEKIKLQQQIATLTKEKQDLQNQLDEILTGAPQAATETEMEAWVVQPTTTNLPFGGKY